MGAINYGSGGYINLGFDSRISEQDMDGEAMLDLSDSISEIIEDAELHWFNVVIRAGYYDGFYLIVNDELPAYFYNKEEKDEAFEEAVRLSDALDECIDAGMICYQPGWIMGWLTKEESKREVEKAYKKMNDAISESEVENI